MWAFTLLRMGCYAQRTCLPAILKLLTPAPSNLGHDEAAAISYGGLVALHFLNKANIESDQQVLVYGASRVSQARLRRARGLHVTKGASSSPPPGR